MTQGLQGIRLATQPGLQRSLLPIIQQQVTLQQAIVTITTNLTALDGGKEPIGAAAAALASHTGASDPHSQYATDADLAGLSTSFAAGLAGKEAVGTAAAAITAHAAASNPHSQYATTAALTAGLAAKEVGGTAAAAIAAHTAAADPHSQYATDADFAGLSTSFTAGLAGKETIGAAAAALASHTGAANPHSQYATTADLLAGLATKLGSVNWAVPGAIGTTTPNTAKFTSLNLTSNANCIGESTGAFICLGGASISRNVWIGAQLQVMDAFKHSGVVVGFYGVPAVARQTVSGSRGGNAALASVITAMKNLGLIIDSTTA